MLCIDDLILVQAKRTAAAVRRHYAQEQRWSDDDFADAVQAGAENAWRAYIANGGRADDPASFLYAAARNGVLRWLFREWRGKRSVCYAVQLDRIVETSIDQDTRPWSRVLEESELPAIWQLCYNARSKRGERGEWAADADVAILYLLSLGYSNAAIGRELGMSQDNVAEYRSNLKIRLSRIAQEKSTC